MEESKCWIQVRYIHHISSGLLASTNVKNLLPTNFSRSDRLLRNPRKADTNTVVFRMGEPFHDP